METKSLDGPRVVHRCGPSWSSVPTSCIYIVDERIRNLKPDAYTPDTVSIGPYHRDNKNRQMQLMEALKSQYEVALVIRTGISREEYKEAIKAMELDPRDYYFDRSDLPDEEEFLEVMLVDGLFIIELFCKYAKAKPVGDAKESGVKVDADEESVLPKKKRKDKESGVEVDEGVASRWTQAKKVVLRWTKTKKNADEESGVEVDVDADEEIVVEVDADADEEIFGVEVDAGDPIFYSNLKRARVIRDLALLENQIPMSVLQTLFDLSKNPKLDKLSLVELTLHFFDALIPNGKGKYTSSKKNGSNVEHKHLLDLLSFTLEAPLPPQNEQLPTPTLESLPCVTDLRHSGVQFMRSKNKNGSLMDLQFHKNGVFEIPPICVSDFTDPFFRNLIAYEQHRYEGRDCMTSYALLMDYLINSAADVASLRDSDIISNHLGDDNKVASLFNNLCCEIHTGNFIYGSLCNDVRKHYKFFWNEWKASLQRDFCNSPWTIIPVVAAVILLLLSLWSALFAAFPTFNVTFKH